MVTRAREEERSPGRRSSQYVTQAESRGRAQIARIVFTDEDEDEDAISDVLETGELPA
jgi:hypothetical protein